VVAFFGEVRPKVVAQRLSSPASDFWGNANGLSMVQALS
jgi:hypothetical protein